MCDPEGYTDIDEHVRQTSDNGSEVNQREDDRTAHQVHDHGRDGEEPG